MSSRPQVARSLADFVKIVSGLEDGGLYSPWFRGQASAEWGLTPKIYRHQRGVRDSKAEGQRVRSDDDEIREGFIRRAANLSDIKPTNEWDWYFVMQHYGAKTRLLDWTDGALLGLYFALRENKGYDDAAVWAMDAWELNRRVVDKYEVIPPGDPGTSVADKQRYGRWLRSRFTPGRWGRWPVAIYPGHIMRRIGAQRSCFTIHGSDRRGLDVIAREMGVPTAKIVIPSWQVGSMKLSLETCGIDETTVFPDLEGLGRVVNEWIEPAKTRPHDKVYSRLKPSKVHKGGVGVFAIIKIKKGAYLFHGDLEEMKWIEKSKLPRRPTEIRKLYKDFAVITTDEVDKKTRYGCPVSFNRLSVAWYINRSHKPNVRCDENYHFFARRDIDKGEELTVDYSTYSEEE
jgi:hypothetical protein